jgi:hypothetical protein
MKTQVGTIIQPDGTELTVRPGNGKKFSLQELQHVVGGYIERVQLRPGNGRGTMYVNEEGKLEGLQRNQKATAMVLVSAWGDFIVGLALIVRVEDRPKGATNE